MPPIIEGAVIMRALKKKKLDATFEKLRNSHLNIKIYIIQKKEY